MSATAATPVPTRVGVYFAFLQFLFTLTWVVYVIYLPALAAKTGIARGDLVWILMADQVIFAFMDVAMGMWADRVSAVYARFARVLVMVSLASCAAFLLLPFVTGLGAPIFIALIFVWSVTSSALRAPPLVLIGRYAAVPDHPWLAGLMLLGLGIGGAVTPFIGFRMRDIDPAIPFVASNIALALVTLGLTWAARTLGSGRVSQRLPDQGGPKPRIATIAAFLAVVLLAGLGFQLHTSVNSVPQYLRLASPDALEHLLPVFWVGFNLAILPASALARRTGAVTVMAGGGFVGGLALLAVPWVDTLPALIASQFIAGAAWSAILMSAFAAALALGHTGREGRINGALFGLLAVATFARMGIVAAQLNNSPSVAPVLPWLSALAWIAAALALLFLWRALRRHGIREIADALVGRRRAPG